MDLETRLEALRANAREYGKWESKRVYLSEFRHSCKALQMKAAEVDGVKTAAAQEREAYASKDYRDLLKALETATQEAVRLRWELEIAREGIRAWQTVRADQRAERKAYGA